MHPDIISLGPFTIRSYGLFLAIGFLFGIWLASYRAKKAGENPDNVYNLSVWIVVSSLLGARLYYILTHYEEFRSPEGTPLFSRFFIEFKNMFWPIGSDGQVGISGLVLYGGLIAATIVTIIYIKKHGLNIPKYLDILGPSLGIGEFFTRIGCFFNGCCFGKPTESIFGVVFPDCSSAGYYFPMTPLHPAQLYNSLSGLIIAGLLLYLERYKRFNGYTALLYFIFYATGRFILDYFRYYETKLTFWGLSHNQLISLAIFTVAVYLFIHLNIKYRKTTGNASYKS